MAKISAKNLILLLNGYVFSTYASSYEATKDAGALDVTGFTDQNKNFTPGLPTSEMSATMFWDSDAGKTAQVLAPFTNGVMTVIPEGYYLGCPTLSLPYMQGNYAPKGTPSSVLEVGTIKFLDYGSNYGIEYGVALAHGVITATTTGTGVQDPAGADVTAVCVGTLHIWTATITDTYVVKIQHSTTLGTGYSDLITFVSNGTTVGVERIQNASGVIHQYRRVLATRTGTGDNFGFSVHFWHN